jgi:DNA-binding transcriptional ArsR family regulator
MSKPLTEDELNAVAAVLKALAHEIRLMLMHALLHHGEKSVSELETLTKVGQPGLSQQLAILRKAGLVHTRRRAKMIFYRLAPESLAPTAQLLAALAASEIGAARPETVAEGRPATGSAATFAQIL